jgi:hypothetical protein
VKASGRWVTILRDASAIMHRTNVGSDQSVVVDLAELTIADPRDLRAVSRDQLGRSIGRLMSVVPPHWRAIHVVPRRGKVRLA